MSHTDTHPIQKKNESRAVPVLIGIFSGVATVLIVAFLANLKWCHHA